MHEGGDTGNPKGATRRPRAGAPARDRELWTAEEVTLVLAACPPDTQNYRPEAPWVRELADLLGRTPGAISQHLGNIFTLKQPGRGLANVGRETIRVFDKYRDRPAELQQDAAALRDRYFGELVSPRVEKHVTEEEAANLEQELTRRFPEAHLPTGSVILYRHPGSIWFGVLVPLNVVLLYPSEAGNLLRTVLEVLGDVVRKTPGVDLTLDGRVVELAEREIAYRAPLFHSHELSEKDRITLALMLRSLKSLRKWKPSARRLDLYSAQSLEAEKGRIRTYFRIDVEGLCLRCLHVLLDALDDALATGKF
ncbi:MAG: hypothetical protein ABSB97_00010 [Thermoplasmata archaeon]|jgi:hypothetical protein